MEIEKVGQKMPSIGQMYEKMPLHGDFALYRNDQQIHREGQGYCHNSRYFNVIFRTELSFIRVNISAFQR